MGRLKLALTLTGISSFYVSTTFLYFAIASSALYLYILSRKWRYLNPGKAGKQTKKPTRDALRVFKNKFLETTYIIVPQLSGKNPQFRQTEPSRWALPMNKCCKHALPRNGTPWAWFSSSPLSADDGDSVLTEEGMAHTAAAATPEIAASSSPGPFTLLSDISAQWRRLDMVSARLSAAW